MSSKNLKLFLLESLVKLGGKVDGTVVSFIKPSLAIKHKKSGVEYTIAKVDSGNGNIYCYRYYNKRLPNEKKKKLYLLITKKDFSKYEPV